jgi:hypothetical protein
MASRTSGAAYSTHRPLDADFVCSVNWAFKIFWGGAWNANGAGLDAGLARRKHVELPAESGVISEPASAA